MDQQPPNSFNRLPQDNTPPDAVEQPTQPTQPPVVAADKKSHKRAAIMAVIGLLVIAGAIVGYMLYTQMTSDSTQNSSQSNTSTSNAPALTPLEETTKILTDGTDGESSLSEDNDSSDADDASKAAGNVGDGVNENNL